MESPQIPPRLFSVSQLRQYLGCNIGEDALRAYLKTNMPVGVVKGKGKFLIQIEDAEKLRKRIGKELVQIGNTIIEVLNPNIGTTERRINPADASVRYNREQSTKRNKAS